MTDVSNEAQEGSPLDELRNLSELAERIAPEIARVIGDIAAQGATVETQALLEDAAVVAERLQQALDTVFVAINDAPVFDARAARLALEASEPRPIDQELVAQEVIVFAMAGQSFQLEDLRASIPSLSALTGDEFRVFVEQSFPGVKQRVQELLLLQGLVSEWSNKTDDNGTRFTLNIEGYSAPVPEREINDEVTEKVLGEEGVSKVVVVELDDEEGQAPDVEDGLAPNELVLVEEEAETEVVELRLEPVPPEIEVEKYGLPDIPELQLSDFEKQVAQRVVILLSGFEERQSLRYILSQIFGRSRLPRSVEGRLVQIFDAYAEAGRLRAYGRSYGYKTGAELQAATAGAQKVAEQNGEELDETYWAMLDYIVAHAQNGEINIGEIIRRHIGVEVLPRSQHLDLIDALNYLADLDYLVHAAGSPWYGIGPKLQAKIAAEQTTSGWQERNFPHLSEMPLVFMSDQLVMLRAPESKPELAYPVDEEHSEPETPELESEPLPAPDGEAEPTDPEVVTLDPVLAELLAVLLSGGRYRMEELRGAVSLLKAMTDADYNAFKTAFAKTGKQNIKDYLAQHKPAVTLEQDGKARGVTYWVEANGKLVTPKPLTGSSGQQDRDEPMRVVRDRSPTRRIGAEEVVESLTGALPLPTFTTDDSGVEIVQIEPIDKRRLLSHIAAREAQDDRVGLKLPAVVRVVVDASGWGQDVAAKVVKAFQRDGSLRIPAAQPHKKGTPVLTAQEVESVDIDQVRNASGELVDETEGGEKEDVRQWTAEDTQIATRVLDALLKLQHVQQGKEPKDLEKELGIPEEGSKSFRWTLHKMKRRGLVIIDKNANPNTRSDHSKKIYVPHVKLPSQKFKKEWKNSRQQVLDRMKSFEVTSELVTTK